MEEKDNTISLKYLLENKPPGFLAKIPNLYEFGGVSYTGPYYKLLLEDIQIYCIDKDCCGTRYFAPIVSSPFLTLNVDNYEIIVYQCKNCNKYKKIYALKIFPEKDTFYGEVIKIGEFPSFGQPIPSRVVTLIGPDRELFLRGWRSENQGMGIAAYAYYRRVLENQKVRIFDNIIKVLRKINAPKNVIEEIESAKGEFHFTQAIEKIKSGLPDILLIENQNPLTLLHSALSQGLHDETDEECLTTSSIIRTILFELSDRITHILKNTSELQNAVKKLIKKKNNPANLA